MTAEQRRAAREAWNMLGRRLLKLNPPTHEWILGLMAELVEAEEDLAPQRALRKLFRDALKAAAAG